MIIICLYFKWCFKLFINSAKFGLEVTGNKMILAERQTELEAEPLSTEKVFSAIIFVFMFISMHNCLWNYFQILEKTLQPTSYMAYQEWIHEASEDGMY